MIKHLTSFFTRALLALALAGGANTAFAGPMYHFTVDTTNLTGTGYLDLTFAALAGATPATATLTHFTGAFGGTALPTGDVGGDIGTAVTLGNGQTFNELLQAVTFGGLLGFDAAFDIAPGGTIGTGFGIALVNAALDNYVPGTMGNVASIDLMPGAPATVWADAAFVTATKVPEPAGLPVFATGCVLAALTLRRRNRGQSPNLGN
ncbi:NF038129 family PEP-CTERM protein [Massilia orientalis]|uniref:NF038129 family PEP-CTERM protein n=1 Tax=Massilia orientalis TaxID=3050128 RepID=A0ACC7MD53_9BURK|nr:NF038129 family PEP-CTERM protein [Massilia sp. YIM B02787]